MHEQQSRRRYAANGFAFVPHVPLSWAVIVGCRNRAVKQLCAVELHFSSHSPFKEGRPKSDRGRIALARFGSSVIVIRQASEGKRGYEWVTLIACARCGQGQSSELQRKDYGCDSV